jgi:hypothetical protein
VTDSTGFSEWLRGHAKEESLTGSLARCAVDDQNWPAQGDLATYQDHLAEVGASPELDSALHMAWEKFTATHG